MGTWMFHWIGGRATLAIGAVMFAGGVGGSALVTNMYGFLVLLPFSLGFGPALIAHPATFLSWLCLPDRKGLATGVTWLGYGFGGMTYGLVFTFLVNPDNLTPDKDVIAGNQTEKIFGSAVAAKVPMALGVSGLVIAGVCLAACVCVMEAKEEDVRKELSGSVAAKELAPESVRAECPSVRRALHTRSLYLLFLFFWLYYVFPLTFIYQYKNYGLQYSQNDHLLSATGTVGLFCNSITRFLVSTMADYVPYKTLMTSITIALGLLAASLQFIVRWTYVYLVWVCLIFSGYGALYSPTTLFCGEIYGAKIGSKVFSLVSQGLNMSSISMVPVGFFLIEVRNRQKYGYDLAFVVLGGVSVTAGGVLAMVKTSYHWERSGVEERLNETQKGRGK